MNHRRIDDSESRFAAYVDGLASVIGHKDREGPLRDYCTGLLMPCERKSVEPMAAITAPHRTAAQHQSLLHFVGEGRWSDERVFAKVREMVVPQLERHGAIEAWIIDDTGFPKQGEFCPLVSFHVMFIFVVTPFLSNDIRHEWSGDDTKCHPLFLTTI